MAAKETRKAAVSLKHAVTSMLENFGLGSSYRLPSVLLSLTSWTSLVFQISLFTRGY